MRELGERGPEWPKTQYLYNRMLQRSTKFRVDAF